MFTDSAARECIPAKTYRICRFKDEAQRLTGKTVIAPPTAIRKTKSDLFCPRSPPAPLPQVLLHAVPLQPRQHAVKRNEWAAPAQKRFLNRRMAVRCYV
ncbi:hypothetical protein KCP78_07315 [Salmonella enterica subsp. enterica]|nr:hypothetical protein KCP78_07315 [Salmonella enterica subsp. enterica]